MTQTINIADDFTRYPGGRYTDDGPGNGTDFREKFLVPVLENNEKAIIVLDGSAGYPSSFLDEAFAGLVRVHSYNADKVLDSFVLKADEPGFSRFVELIKKYVRSATPANASHA